MDDKKYLDLAGLQSYDKKIKEYLAAADLKDKNELLALIGTLPEGEDAAKTLVDYIDAKAAGVDGQLAAIAKSGKAIDVSIDDEGNFYKAETVEAALQELAKNEGIIALAVKAEANRASGVEQEIKDLVGEIPVQGEGEDAVPVASSLVEYVGQKVEEINGAADDLSDRIDALEATHAKKDEKSFKTVAEEVSEAIAEVVAEAPEAFDTLKEIADWIEKDAKNENGFDAANRIVALETAVGKEAVMGKDEEGNDVVVTPGSGLVAAVTALQEAVGDEGSVNDMIDDAIDDLQGETDSTVADVEEKVDAFVTITEDEIAALFGVVAEEPEEEESSEEP